MTKPNPFGAAILLLGKGVDKLREELGGEPVATELEAAIRLLEIGGDFTADDKERVSTALDNLPFYTPLPGYKCPGQGLRDKFIALLSALPDKEK